MDYSRFTFPLCSYMEQKNRKSRGGASGEIRAVSCEVWPLRSYSHHVKQSTTLCPFLSCCYSDHFPQCLVIVFLAQ